jgi:hypothetical protein
MSNMDLVFSLLLELYFAGFTEYIFMLLLYDDE